MNSRTRWLFALLVSMLGASAQTHASTADCQGLYVGRIWIEKGQGLYGVVLLNSPNDASGSYWIMFLGWTDEEKKAALATLTAAKLTQHRVHVATTETNGCGIASDQRIVKSLWLSNEP